MAERKAWVSPYADLGAPGLSRRFVEVDAPEPEPERKSDVARAALDDAEAAAVHLAEPKPSTGVTKSNSGVTKSSGAPVTKSKRGGERAGTGRKPKSGNALSAAEKQRAYRERKKGK